MKKVLLICSLILGNMMSHAQYHSEFDTLKSTNDGEIIWKGSCTFNDLEKVPAFNLHKQFEAYTPDAGKLNILTAELKQYQLVILLGTWCEDSHRLIPQLYRVLHDVGYPFEQIQIFALDRDKKGRAEEELKYKVTNVPTIIVLQNGKEKGRITETVNKSIESDLAEILKK